MLAGLIVLFSHLRVRRSGAGALRHIVTTSINCCPFMPLKFLLVSSFSLLCRAANARGHAQGGAIASVFDALMALNVRRLLSFIAPTACLTVSYKIAVPIGQVLIVYSKVTPDPTSSKKFHVEGKLMDCKQHKVYCVATALFVIPKAQAKL